MLLRRTPIPGVKGMDELPYWLALNRLPGLDPARFALVLAVFQTARRAWEAGGRDIARVARLAGESARLLIAARRKVEPLAEYDKLVRKGYAAITWDSPEYPRLLRYIDDPPPVLYCFGRLAPRDDRAAAIVGARRADDYGLKAARRLARDLAGAGVTVVSGLARGVDAAAHRGALEGGGRTVAVLGSGIDVIYPQEHRRLYLEIAENGAVLSEHPPGTRPKPEHFPLRNRIISGLSRVVVIAQAGDRSGALITADLALEQGREVMAVPGDVFRFRSAGANRLLREGAAPALEAADVLAQMAAPWGEPGARHAAGAPGEGGGDRPEGAPEGALTSRSALSDTEEKVYSLLSRDPRRLEELARGAGLPVGTATAALVLLEIKGFARRLPGPYYVLS